MGNQMQSVYEYRSQLMAHIPKKVREFRAAVEAVADPQSALEPGGWNTHQLTSHVRDVATLVYGERVRKTALEDNPVFQNFDADEWMAAHYEPDEPLGKMLDEIVSAMTGMATLLSSLPHEGWSRLSSHAVYGGGFTLQTWVERGLAHIEEHLKTVKG